MSSFPHHRQAPQDQSDRQSAVSRPGVRGGQGREGGRVTDSPPDVGDFKSETSCPRRYIIACDLTIPTRPAIPRLPLWLTSGLAILTAADATGSTSSVSGWNRYSRIASARAGRLDPEDQQPHDEDELAGAADLTDFEHIGKVGRKKIGEELSDPAHRGD